MALMVVAIECVEREGVGVGGLGASLSGMWRGTPASSGCGARSRPLLSDPPACLIVAGTSAEQTPLKERRRRRQKK